MDKYKSFTDSLSDSPESNVFNPWRDACSLDLDTSNPQNRQERLINHIAVEKPDILLIGEAPGYQGCRYSGVAFTSERLLCEGAVPRLEHFTNTRITSRQRPWSEPSATIIWKALYEHQIAETTVLWNAFPWHPVGKKGDLSNRTPTNQERIHGEIFLRNFLDLYPNSTPVAALGRTASTQLEALGVAHTCLRHPANGGAPKFREGLRNLLASAR